jgi:hypothetical protein
MIDNWVRKDDLRWLQASVVATSMLSGFACYNNAMIDKRMLSHYFAALGRKSVKARMKNSSPEERQRIARNAAKARWAKAKKPKNVKSRAGRKP